MKTRQNKDIKNMTTGSPARLLLLFALPLMAGNVFQQLYTVTDTAIVGRALGVEALAALGTVEWFSWMSLGLVQGITQGFAILLAQRFGAEDHPGLRRALGNACVLSVLCALIMTTLMEALVGPMFVLMRTPAEVIPTAALYLRIIFAGIPIVMLYNMASSVLRALGDGRSPLMAMVIASVINIGLDLLFVLKFGWGVAGAAVATLLAQLFASGFCLLKVRKIRILAMTREDFANQGTLRTHLISLAIPMAFQNMIIAVGGMIVQTVVNHYGVAFIAGYTATNRLYGILEVAAISYGFAMTTYAGQNLGAGQRRRISDGLRAGLVIGVATSILIALMMFTLGKPILGCFIDTSGAQGQEAMRIAFDYLRIMSLFLPVLYVLHVVRSTIQGLGNTVIPMVSGIAEFVMRMLSAFFLPLLLGESGILFAEIIAWAGADVILIPGYMRTINRVKRNA
ncbi:MAG: MATE family efflux transporter [Lachnospiraceae bacterium]|nr:MATE family efflux transporter [Lachnospiraceae bacterium]